ncbi:MAG: hypothetical protein JF603_05285 [Acidobacteria bacterium]|nr:hypothetical protein [Acidobacteriota bacterium]
MVVALATFSSASRADAQTSATPSDPPPVLIQGSGPSTSSPFQLSGVALFTINATSHGPLVIHLVRRDGQLVCFIVTAWNTYNGTLATSVPAGDYRLEVLASGRWRAVIAQPATRRPVTLPTSQAGRGNGVIGPLPTASGLDLDITHAGSGNFVVRIIDAADPGTSALVNALGRFSARRHIILTEESWISIESDGPWTVLASPTDPRP